MRAKMYYQQPDSRLIEQLQKLQVVGPRDPNAAATGKEQFLLQAQRLAPMPPTRRTGSREGWANLLAVRIRPLHMPKLLMIILAILFIGGGAVSVYAAKGSLPDQPLYGLKMVTEDVQLGLANRKQTRMDLALYFADRRIDEMVKMVSQDYPIPDAVAIRYEEHVENALYLIAQLPDDEIMSAFTVVRQRLHTQEQTIRKIQDIHPADPVINRVHNRMQVRIEQIEDGMDDPNSFRRQFLQGDSSDMNGDPHDRSSDNVDGTEDPSIFPALERTVEKPGPVDGESQPQRTHTPSHNRFMDAYPDENLNESGASQQPWVTGTPSSGDDQGNGPGEMDGDCVNCDPESDGPGPRDDPGQDSNDEPKNEGGQPGMNMPDSGGGGGGEGAGNHGGGGEKP